MGHKNLSLVVGTVSLLLLFSGLHYLLPSDDYASQISYYSLFPFQSRVFDYGEVIEGDILKHSFVISNNSDGIIVLNVRSSCGCTKAKLSGKTIKPRKATKIAVWLDTTGRNGHVEQYLDITTNKNGTFRLRLCAEVLHEVEVSPDRLWLGEVPRNVELEREVFFSKRNDDEFTITQISAPLGVQFEQGEKTVQEGITEIPILFKINTGDTLGYYQKTIQVETDHSKVKEYEIVITGEVLPDLKVIPSRIDFCDAEPGAVVTKNIRITPVRKSIESVSARIANDYVTIEECVREAEQFIFPVSIKVPENLTGVQDTIKVYYDGKTETDILIPVNVTIAL